MKLLLWLLGIAGALYVLVCLMLYFQQEHLLFFPTRLPADYRFRFPGRWQERWITAPDGVKLNGLLFRAEGPRRGLVFYLHGNGGALDGWGDVAPLYTALGYDVFLLDYRGYGKSPGRIGSEAQLKADVEAAYRQLTADYPEQQTVVLGYSLGTGLAAWLAARHQPRLLVLQAPYYSMQDMARSHYPWVPGFLVRYPLRTYEVLPRVQAPVLLFHGTADEVIYPASSAKLRALLPASARLVELPGAGHNGMTDNPQYQRTIRAVLGAD
ncbi:alpha/beta fold hydrolase [Hymenobacter gummosus]|uniref:Alpha/beta fold hydrolase n=1 Tax=Hymenobacter gummosus TaxID=1776032 RepID=A0A3S0H3Q2_9BACT|nr:alpha/beta fold hydrolase [Hymenobacter gummosus]RTQ46741.1 alpha/beta fold hydrolase [Hymenobacter gummosus]